MRSAVQPTVTLRPLDARDAEHIHALNEDPEVLTFVHDVPFASVQAASEWIANIPEALPHGIGRWAIEALNGSWIGRCSLRRQADGEVLMGYRLLRAHWGKGYASAAVRSMLNVAFHTHKLPYVASKVARANAASIRVIEKNGGVFWKEDDRGHFSDALVYRFHP